MGLFDKQGSASQETQEKAAILTTLLITQSNGAEHLTPPGHPERPQRLKALTEAFAASRFSPLRRRDARPADLALAAHVHGPEMLAALAGAQPAEGIGRIESDTFMSHRSLEVAATALGAALAAIEDVMQGKADNAFCAIRPPGHHAERDRSMGFCLVNTIAIAAEEARRSHGVERIAIVDFDVHHGNGTQDIFWNDRNTFYGSSHQSPLYPGSGEASETGVGNIFNAPLAPYSAGPEMREAYEERILPALRAFRPELLLISAGFDADARDPLAQLGWGPEDFAWVTGKLMDEAGRSADNRVVSLLEGGYDLDGLAEGASAHLGTLMTGMAAAAAE
jgi:acetoin utilization deacetylase AcuC-like enzyme